LVAFGTFSIEFHYNEFMNCDTSPDLTLFGTLVNAHVIVVKKFFFHKSRTRWVLMFFWGFRVFGFFGLYQIFVKKTQFDGFWDLYGFSVA